MAHCFTNCCSSCCYFFQYTRTTEDGTLDESLDKIARSLPYCAGKWLPSHQFALDRWLQRLIEEVDTKTLAEPLNPVIQSFKDAIENNAELTMFFNQMFTETPAQPPTKPRVKQSSPQPKIRDYQHMLQLMNHILLQAPEFHSDNAFFPAPMFAIMYKPSRTIGGYAAFLNVTVNFHLKSIFNEWAKFLASPESCYVLTTDGWFSKESMEKMGGKFEQEFICDPSKPHYGFTSWDGFFTRQFRPNARPVAYPADNKVIVNACESGPWRVERNVPKDGKFWIKGQPYNIKFMLGDDALTDIFEGGTVYQGFLDIFFYHGWHSPVDGVVRRAYVKEGTYYSRPIGETDSSQAYIAEMQTRAIIAIEADNPYIGLMCFIAVGMGEVSSCEITINEGQKVKKGQQIGSFHFGGSTHCLLFRPGVKVSFDFHGEKPGHSAGRLLVNSILATVPE
ncbi:uncharacterized protein [Dysidea avara]|uniref:uncharacterized protein n=1 Tax=Dysidea avara TaxID=196820 RepID=UPI0033188393